MDQNIYPNPTVFNPDRYIDNNIKMNDIYMSPFGLGSRQCPASGSFTTTFWRKAMETIFLNANIEIVNTAEFEDIDINTRHIKLQKRYMATINDINK